MMKLYGMLYKANLIKCENSLINEDVDIHE